MTIQRPDPSDVPVMLRRDLIGAGWHDHAISAMLRARTWTRVRHGAYAVTAQWDLLDEVGRHAVTIRAVLQSAKTGLVVSHASAAVLLGVPTWGIDLGDVHVTRTDGRIGRHEAGVHQHCGVLADDDLSTVGDIAVTSGTRTALELCTMTSVEAGVAAVSHLLHAGRTSPELLAERYTRAAAMVHWPRSRTTDLVLRLADPRFESVGESRTFHLLWRSHLPAPVPQHEVLDDAGRVVARLDFAWPDLGVFLEFDGRVKYEALLGPGQSASDVVVREKRREELICRLTGWRCLRLTWADLERPERTAATIRSFLFDEPRTAA